MNLNPIKDVIAGLGAPIAEIIGNVADNKIQKGTAIVQLQAALSAAEEKSDEVAASVIMAEAKGESWLQRNWRPITALSFTGLFLSFPILFAFGIDVAPLGIALGHIPGSITAGVFTMVGGYMGARSFVDKRGGAALEALTKVLTKKGK